MIKTLLGAFVDRKITYSQYLQDVFVDFVFFLNEKKGYFIDIGAFDGLKFSNSYLFEKDKGWNGIAIEPNEKVFADLKKNRNCVLVNGVVSDVDGVVEYMRVDGEGAMLGGIVNNLADKHKDRIGKTVEKFGGEAIIESVKSYSIRTLIKENKVSNISLLSIDTEGSELQILKSFPFDVIRPTVILVENNYRSKEFSDFLSANGYHYCFRLGDDVFFNQPITIAIKYRIWLFRMFKKFGIYKIGY